VGEVPITLDRSASAKVAVRSGETIVLGGFISQDKDFSRSGVPFLKDIPGLGLLFSARSENKNRRELMIFIKPTVLETPEIAAKVALEEKGKMPGVMEAEREFGKEAEDLMQKERQRAKEAAEEEASLKSQDDGPTR
jgi:type II secretory pathway component GspD/PulD (secretin)